MSTPNKNGNGAKEVTPATNSKPATTKVEPTAEELKAQALKEQQEYFDGLAQLVSMRGRYNDHKVAVEELTFERTEAELFEHTSNHGGKITLSDFSGNSYEIKNPKLVIEVRDFILARLNVKIQDLEDGIFSYSEKRQSASK